MGFVPGSSVFIVQLLSVGGVGCLGHVASELVDVLEATCEA